MRTLSLDNGLTLVLDKYPGKSTGLDLCFNFGSAFEKREEAGIAHFLEHMFFSGSKLGKRKPFEKVEGKGGELNASTSKEETHYHSRIQNNEAETPVEVLAKCFNEGHFKEKEVELEKQIILNEIRQARDHPVRRLFDEFIEICLPAPFGRRTIGLEKTVKKITASKLEKRLRKNYLSQSTVLGIVTSLNEEKIVNLIEENFNQRKGRKALLKEKKIKPKSVERKSTVETQQAHCCLGFPVMNALHKDYYLMELIEAYLGGGLSSRLVQEIREKRGLSYSVNTYLDSERAHGVFLVYFSTAPQKVRRVKKIVIKEFESLQRKELEKSVLKRAKKNLIGSKILDLENSFKSAQDIVHAHLYNKGSFEDRMQKIKKATAKNVKKTAKEFLQTEEFAFASLFPPKKSQ